MTVEQIEQFIKEAIPDATVEIEDLKGDGDHYSATVTSKSFSGKTRVEQHKRFMMLLMVKWVVICTHLS